MPGSTAAAGSPLLRKRVPPAAAVFNLANRIDERATETKVVEYERANRLTIIANQARVVSLSGLW